MEGLSDYIDQITIAFNRFIPAHQNGSEQLNENDSVGTYTSLDINETLEWFTENVF